MNGGSYFSLHPERAHDGPAIEALLDLAFGPDRKQLSSYRLRKNRLAVNGLSFVLRHGDEIYGTIRFWPVVAGSAAALLLGPLAVHPERHGHGGGQMLMRAGLNAARAGGHGLVFLVGDLPYYERAGFMRVPPGRVQMPGAYDPARLLYQELTSGAFDGASGMIAQPARG